MITYWIENTIIGLNLCPFTAKPYYEGKVQIVEVETRDLVSSKEKFLDVFNDFQNQSDYVTALVAFPELETSFEDFNDFVYDCENIILSLGLGELFQLVVFHPEFRFQGLKKNARANLVNCSPAPLIHILRRVDLDMLNLKAEEGKRISLANEKLLKSLSKEELFFHFPWHPEF